MHENLWQILPSLLDLADWMWPHENPETARRRQKKICGFDVFGHGVREEIWPETMGFLWETPWQYNFESAEVIV